MSEWFTVLSGLLGGLAIFIYGMNMMSEGLQKCAGEKMKYILSILTKNPVMGVLAGAITTAVLQSSSATTVMVIGFVSAGLMSLPQAISVILGANIGTTMTAQLIAFKIDDFIWPIIFVGFVFFFFARKEQIKNVGQTIFAFGLLFLGITSMGGVMKPLASLPIFITMIEKVSEIPVLGVLTGTIMTMVVQSSSATIAILQNFAKQPMVDGVTSVIGLEGAIPILFGDNIGTTITALLACIGQNKNAKRTALSHSVFNISGSLLFIWFIPAFADFVRMISPKGPEIEIISRQIANAHTTFNIVNTIIWIPLIWLMVKIVMLVIPGEEADLADEAPRFLDEKLLEQPIFAMHLCIKELSRIADFAESMINHARAAIQKLDKAEIDEVTRLESIVDNLQDATVKYISTLTSIGSLTETQGVQLAGLMHVANDIERVGDRCVDIIKAAQTMIEKNYTFSEEALQEINDSFDIVQTMLVESVQALQNSDKELANKVLEDEDRIDNLEVRLRKRHMKRLNEKICSPSLSVVYTEVLHNIERIGDHCKNIAEVTIGDTE